MGTADIVFTIAKTFAKNSDTAFKSASRLAKSTKKVNASAVLAKMGPGSFFKNVELPQVSVKTSKLFHTPAALKQIKHADLLPNSTSDLLTSLSKSSSTIGDVGKTLSKVDASSIAKAAKASSVTKLKGISEGIAKLTAKNASFIGKKNIKQADEVLDAKQFKNVDELSTAMKAKKRVVKTTGEATAKAGKKADALNKSDGLIDDAAKQAKQSKLMKGLKFIAKNDGKINLAIFGSFIIGNQVANANTKYPTVQTLTADPGTRVTSIITTVDGASLTAIDEAEDSITTSNAAVLGVVALAAASFMLI